MFEDRLKRLREARGFGQKEVSDQLNLKLRTYSSYENNEREPNSEVLVAMSKFFGVSIDYLLGVDKLRVKQNYSTNPKDNEYIRKYIGLNEVSKNVVNCVIDYAEQAETTTPQTTTIYRAARSIDNHPAEIIETTKDFSKIPPTDIKL